jgi:hypothetical protein
MTKLTWRIKFVIAYRDIFSKPKGSFKINLLHGWEVSGDVYANLKHLSPHAAALLEITRWYDYD